MLILEYLLPPLAGDVDICEPGLGLELDPIELEESTINRELYSLEGLKLLFLLAAQRSPLLLLGQAGREPRLDVRAPLSKSYVEFFHGLIDAPLDMPQFPLHLAHLG